MPRRLLLRTRLSGRSRFGVPIVLISCLDLTIFIVSLIFLQKLDWKRHKPKCRGKKKSKKGPAPIPMSDVSRLAKADTFGVKHITLEMLGMLGVRI